MNTNRILPLDIVKVFAIFLMIITHIYGFFSFNYSFILDKLTYLGSTVCFISFVFCFAYIHGMKLHKPNTLESQNLNTQKTPKLFIAYYFTAIFAYYIINNSISISSIINIFLLQSFPEFTEFILYFILMSFLYNILKPFYISFSRQFNKTFFFISVSVLLSAILYRIAFPIESLNNIKSLISGHNELHTFGILSYFPVYALGLYWGYHNHATNLKISIYGVLSCLAIYFVLTVCGLNIWHRWPPSIFFLNLGILFVFITLSISILLRNLIIKLPLISNCIQFISKNVFNLYILNVIIILALKPIFVALNIHNFNINYLTLIIFIVVTIATLLFNRFSTPEK